MDILKLNNYVNLFHRIKINKHIIPKDIYVLNKENLDNLLKIFIENGNELIYHGDKVKVTNLYEKHEISGTVVGLKIDMESELDFNYLKYDIKTAKEKTIQVNYQNLELITRTYGNKLLMKKINKHIN